MLGAFQIYRWDVMKHGFYLSRPCLFRNCVIEFRRREFFTLDRNRVPDDNLVSLECHDRAILYTAVIFLVDELAAF